MTWTSLVIIVIAIIALSVIVGVQLRLLERRPIIYSQKKRCVWAIAIAATFSLGLTSGAPDVYWFFGIVLGIAVYISGPQYYQYRIKPQFWHNVTAVWAKHSDDK